MIKNSTISARKHVLKSWIQEVLGILNFSFVPLPGDASFRQYFRISYNSCNKIVVATPLPSENLNDFIKIHKILTAHNIRVPEIFYVNIAEGFAIIEDLGNTLMFDVVVSKKTLITPPTFDFTNKLSTCCYLAAINIINKFHIPISLSLSNFPLFDINFILQELELFRTWFLKCYLNLDLSFQEEKLLDEMFALLAYKINLQPKVLIHRDYHSRNIMLLNHQPIHSITSTTLEDIELGIIDFQDAMLGPFTYDLVSLLKDCYLSISKTKILTLLQFFYKNSIYNQEYSLDKLLHDFNLCGIQRHLKVLGVFCRLYLRDKKPQYLKYLPHTLKHITDSLKNYLELAPLSIFIQKRIKLP